MPTPFETSVHLVERLLNHKFKRDAAGNVVWDASTKLFEFDATIWSGPNASSDHQNWLFGGSEPYMATPDSALDADITAGGSIAHGGSKPNDSLVGSLYQLNSDANHTGVCKPTVSRPIEKQLLYWAIKSKFKRQCEHCKEHVVVDLMLALRSALSANAEFSTFWNQLLADGAALLGISTTDLDARINAGAGQAEHDDY